MVSLRKGKRERETEGERERTASPVRVLMNSLVCLSQVMFYFNARLIMVPFCTKIIKVSDIISNKTSLFPWVTVACTCPPNAFSFKCTLLIF